MSVLIKNARIYTMESGVIENGYICENGGVISDIGNMDALPSGDFVVIDAGGAYLLPGLIDAHTHAGLFRDSSGDAFSALSSDTPYFKTACGIDLSQRAFSDALRHGVTCHVCSPASGAVATGSVCAVSAEKDGAKILSRLCGFKFALGENPKSEDAETDIRKIISENRELFSPLFERKAPALFHCHKKEDILSAISISEDFGFECILLHATEAPLVPDAILRKARGIITGPVLNTRTKPELKNHSEALFSELSALSPAVCTDFPETPSERLMLCAALSGADELSAFAAITVTPARLFGLDDKIGSLRRGKAFDLVMYDTHPFDLRAKVISVFSKGSRVV